MKQAQIENFDRDSYNKVIREILTNVKKKFKHNPTIYTDLRKKSIVRTKLYMCSDKKVLNYINRWYSDFVNASIKECVNGGYYGRGTLSIIITPKVDMFIPKTYSERQEQWFKDNNIVEGSKVTITRSAKNNENGWDNTFVKEMHLCVGKTGVVVKSATPDSYGVSVEVDGMVTWNYPYFVLKPVIDVKTKKRTTNIADKDEQEYIDKLNSFELTPEVIEAINIIAKNAKYLQKVIKKLS